MYDSSDLSSLLTTQAGRRVTLGMSGDEVYHLADIGAYLKIGRHDGFADLGHERNVLEWLAGRFPSPRLLGYEVTSTNTYLLATEIAGSPASEILSAENASAELEIELARKLAAAIRRLHDMPIDDCTLDQRLDVKFEKARRNIRLNLLSQTDEEFASDHDGMLPMDLFHELLSRRPSEEDLVFTHGDPCMPNILIADNEVAGIVDLGGAGVADRYADIAIFLRSFRSNCRVPVEIGSVFCEAYGIDRIDPDKFDFYLKLDDLF